MVTQNNDRIGCQYEGLSTDTKPTEVDVNAAKSVTPAPAAAADAPMATDVAPAPKAE